jgi:hypothetical protein
MGNHCQFWAFGDPAATTAEDKRSQLDKQHLVNHVQ